MRKGYQVLCFVLATTFGTSLFGKDGKGGGTWSSLFTLVLQFLMYFWWEVNPLWYVGIAVLTIPLGVVVCGPAEQFLFEWKGPGKRHTGEVVKHDRNQDTIDEFDGMYWSNLWVTFARYLQFHWLTVSVLLVIGFAAFRYFDIKKPGKIKQVENWLEEPPLQWIKDQEQVAVNPFTWWKSFTIMVDDVVGGWYALGKVTMPAFLIACVVTWFTR